MDNNKLIKDEIAQELDCDYYKKDMERGNKKTAETTTQSPQPEHVAKPKYRIVDFDPPKDKELAVFTCAKILSEYFFVFTEYSAK
ncbi:MAG: hypothetical protein OSJ74_11905 [Clostridia bacterium]|nr:hypothetical protein [Clostridia bacterium]